MDHLVLYAVRVDEVLISSIWDSTSLDGAGLLLVLFHVIEGYWENIVTP